MTGKLLVIAKIAMLKYASSAQALMLCQKVVGCAGCAMGRSVWKKQKKRMERMLLRIYLG